MAEFHAPKSIKKRELYDYINSLRSTRVGELKDEYSQKLLKLADKLYPLVEDAMAPLDDVREALTRLDLNFLYTVSGCNYAVDRLIGASNQLTSLPSYYARREITSNASAVCSLEWTKEEREKIPGLNSIIREWNTIVSEYKEKITEARKLKDELTQIVVHEKRAAKAYIKLAELGLDMSSFVETVQVTLPAIITTTVDVNIFNIKDEKVK